MVLYVDGGCSGNDQRDITKRSMVAVVTNEHGDVLVEKSSVGGGSNNIAELWAVALALEWCASASVSAVTIQTDSRNNLSWVFGKKVGKGINDRDAVVRLKDTITRHRSRIDLALTWVPRDENLAGHVIEARYGL